MEFEPTATPITARAKWFRTVKDYGMHMDPIALFSGDSLLQVTPLPQLTTSSVVTPVTPVAPSTTLRLQRRRSDGCKAFIQILKVQRTASQGLYIVFEKNAVVKCFKCNFSKL